MHETDPVEVRFSLLVIRCRYRARVNGDVVIRGTVFQVMGLMIPPWTEARDSNGLWEVQVTPRINSQVTTVRTALHVLLLKSSGLLI